jgi:uncharacterized protein (DUF736 family)
MATIGNFTKSGDRYTGAVRTLTLNVKAQIAPAEKENDKAPDYRVFAGRIEIGAGWKKTSGTGREYLSVTREERLRHMAIFGSTGVGKTTFLLNIVAQDIARGDGLLVIDPHGDFAEKALSLVPPSRNNQVCYFNLTDSAYPIGFNVLEDVAPDHRAVVADGVVAGMRAIWIDMWGPRLEQFLM